MPEDPTDTPMDDSLPENPEPNPEGA